MTARKPPQRELASDSGEGMLAFGDSSGELLASVLGALSALWDSPNESEGDGVVWRDVALRPAAFDGVRDPRNHTHANTSTNTAGWELQECCQHSALLQLPVYSRE